MPRKTSRIPTMSHIPANETARGRIERREMPPLERAAVKGSVRVVFWGLRLYIVVMLALVIVGFARGTIGG